MAIAGGAGSPPRSVLTNLTARMDQLVLAGGMAHLPCQGVRSESRSASLTRAGGQEIMARAKQHGCEIVLPHDFVVAKELKAGAEWRVRRGNIPQDQMILDMGPKSVADLKRRFAEMKTLVWNGPVGAFEFEPFGNGTFELMREAARLVRDGKLVAIAGGGDTVAALNIAGVGEDFTYVSTAGGAFLEWLEGKTLPAVAALAQNRA
jgi:phosphoglycerate kinase